jgi:hypothetical protein
MVGLEDMEGVMKQLIAAKLHADIQAPRFGRLPQLVASIVVK